MMKKRMALVFLILSLIALNCQAHVRGALSTQVAEGILAGSLGMCSRYELAHNDQHDANAIKALCAFVRSAHGITFLMNHKHTYSGLKVIMGLLAAHDAVSFIRQYKQLVATADTDALLPAPLAGSVSLPRAHDGETAVDNKALESSVAANTFSTKTHKIAQQIELAAALLLTMCSSHKAAALRCEYLACLAMVAARSIALAEQQKGLLSHFLLACVVGLMVLDFVVPGSPFNAVAAERDREFSEYIDLQEDLVGCVTQLNGMRAVVDQALALPQTMQARERYATLAYDIGKNRDDVRAAMSSHDVSLAEAQEVIHHAQVFCDQRRASIMPVHSSGSHHD